MIEDELVPSCFERERVNDDSIEAKFEAELPGYPTNWETNDTYQVTVISDADDASGMPKYAVEVYDPDLQQTCRDSQWLSLEEDAVALAIGVMVELAQYSEQA